MRHKIFFGRKSGGADGWYWHLNVNALLFATSPQLLSVYRPQGLAALAFAFPVQAPTALCIVASKLQKLHHAPAECSTNLHREGRLSALDATGTLGRAGLETVGELAVDGLEVLHAAGTSGLSPLGLLAPVVCGGMLVVFQSRAMRCRRWFRCRWTGGGGWCATYTS